MPDSDKFYLFVDDCSTDNSVVLVNSLFGKTKYHIITKEQNRGPGDSFNIGFEWILMNSDNKSKIVTLEGDNTSDLSILSNMITISNLGFELVLASIYAQGGGFDKTSLLRKVISLIANMLLRFIYDIKVLTLSSFYRVYDINLLIKIKNKYDVIIREPGFISMIEILIKAIKLNSTIIEVPMTLSSKNRIGKSKMKIMKTTFSYLRFLFKKNK